MKIKIIATDFDGTLLNSKKEITKKTREGLESLKKKGYIIVGVTGRILTTGKEDIDLSLFDYLIINNGANLYSTKTEKEEYLNFIDNKIATEITNFIEPFSKEIDLATINNYYIYKNKALKNKPYIKEINNTKEIKEKISRMNIFLKNEDNVNYYQNLINNKFKNIYAHISEDSFDSKRWIGINPKNINKYTALKTLCERLNVKIEEAIFFGDGLNDLELIDSNCISVAMGNALPIIKEKAKFICKSNNEDGVITFLEEYLNKKEKTWN